MLFHPYSLHGALMSFITHYHFYLSTLSIRLFYLHYSNMLISLPYLIGWGGQEWTYHSIIKLLTTLSTSGQIFHQELIFRFANSLITHSLSRLYKLFVCSFVYSNHFFVRHIDTWNALPIAIISVP